MVSSKVCKLPLISTRINQLNRLSNNAQLGVGVTKRMDDEKHSSCPRFCLRASVIWPRNRQGSGERDFPRLSHFSLRPNSRNSPLLLLNLAHRRAGIAIFKKQLIHRRILKLLNILSLPRAVHFPFNDATTA
jgi:hypothetical protein